MTFEEAKTFTMPFGKHKGKTLDEIAESDRGLRYLDWAVGEFDAGSVRGAIEVYLDDPSIRKELEEIE